MLKLSLIVDSRKGSDGLTTGLQKGLIMNDGETPLCEEGMGFGVPVIVKPSGTYLSFNADTEEFEKDGKTYYRKTFYMDALQRVKMRGKEVESDLRYRWIEACGSIYKRSTYLQRLLPVAVKLRERTGLDYFFKRVEPQGTVTVLYLIDKDKVYIETESDLPAVKTVPMECYLLNEQGAGVFNRYEDSSGRTLSRSSIGGWVRIHAGKAWMTRQDGSLGFAVYNRSDCSLYRGWERASDSLSWSGFIYDVSCLEGHGFSYRIEIIEEPLTEPAS